MILAGRDGQPGLPTRPPNDNRPMTEAGGGGAMRVSVMATTWMLAVTVLLSAVAVATELPLMRRFTFSKHDGWKGGNAATTGCSSQGPGPVAGFHYGFLVHDGIPRRYMVHVPPQAASQPDKKLAAIVNIHGSPFLAPEWVETFFSGLNNKADEAGFLVVYPAGVGSLFNAGACCARTDDVGFTRAVLQDLERHYCVDTRRVYATGLSGGAMMVYRVACEMADVFAAVSPVGGALILDPCNPSRPVPLLHFHGTGDNNVPYNGGDQLYGMVHLKSVEETIYDWAVHKNNCTAGPTVTFRHGVAYCRTWTACNEGSDVELCLLEGTPHCWPGGLCTEYPAPGSNDINANDHMWAFFSRFELPLKKKNGTDVVVAGDEGEGGGQPPVQAGVANS